MIRFWLVLCLFLYNNLSGQNKIALHKSFEVNTNILLSPYHLYQLSESAPLAQFQDIRPSFIKDTIYRAINPADFKFLNHSIDQLLVFQDRDSIISAFRLILPFNTSLLNSMKICFGDNYWQVSGFMRSNGFIDKSDSVISSTYAWSSADASVYLKTVDTDAGRKMVVEIIGRKKTTWP